MTKPNLRPLAAISLDLAGIAGIIGGFTWIWAPLGPILGGIAAIGLAWTIDPPKPKAPQPVDEISPVIGWSEGP